MPLFSPLLDRLTPYVPGEQPGDRQYLKLNANENPYPPSPRAVQAAHDAVDGPLKMYPDSESTSLRRAVAGRFGLGVDQVFIGNGSDEVLALAFMAFFKQDRPLLFPDITYSFYEVYCDLLDIPSRQIPLDDGLDINLDDYAGPDKGGVVFANPNAVTGRLLALKTVDDFTRAHPDQVILVDEAYVDFGGRSAAALIDADHPNLLVVQTLSKSRSLAGLRVGFALGPQPLIAALSTVKNSFNCYPLDRVAMAAAEAAMDDEAYFQETCAKVVETRTHLVDRLTRMGFEVLPSAANFVLARPPKLSAAEYYQALKNEGVLIRYFNRPRLDGYVRISVGTDAEMEVLLDKTAKVLL